MEDNTNKKHYCVISGKEIPSARIEALIMLGIPQTQWTCVEHSTTKPKQGIFMGEHGTSEMKLVDKVYDDSVRTIFSNSDREVAEETPIEKNEEAPVKPGFYSEKEINYYNTGDESDSEEMQSSQKPTNA
jgi:hypothetical protein